MASIHSGAVFWLDGVPPLRGGQPKRRPVIVIEDDLLPPATRGLFLVVATTTDLESEFAEASGEAIPISGLPERCWAIPSWRFDVHAALLTDYIDTLPDVEVHHLVEAVIESNWRGEAGGET